MGAIADIESGGIVQKYSECHAELVPDGAYGPRNCRRNGFYRLEDEVMR